MPNGRTHDIIPAVIAPVVAGISYFLTKDLKTTGIIFVCYLFASLMFNGDLDANTRPYNRAGPSIARLSLHHLNPLYHYQDNFCRRAL